MDPRLLFTLTFPLAAPFWALMILAPGWSVTRRVIGSPLIAVPPVLVYAALVTACSSPNENRGNPPRPIAAPATPAAFRNPRRFIGLICENLHRMY